MQMSHGKEKQFTCSTITSTSTSFNYHVQIKVSQKHYNIFTEQKNSNTRSIELGPLSASMTAGVYQSVSGHAPVGRTTHFHALIVMYCSISLKTHSQWYCQRVNSYRTNEGDFQLLLYTGVCLNGWDVNKSDTLKVRRQNRSWIIWDQRLVPRFFLVWMKVWISWFNPTWPKWTRIYKLIF